MKRILIFGAYANGNLGDAEQAASVARHLKSYNSDLEIVSASHSVADRLYYPGPAAIARNLTDIMNLDFVNSFDALFIGGGGLFASKHKPLANSGWTDGIKIPIVIFGTGASVDVGDICSDIIKKASIVTARDQFSINALSGLRPDTFLLRDPILNDRSIDLMRKPNSNGVAARMCVIPRKLVSKSEAAYKTLSEAMLTRDFVISVFPTTDEKSGALGYFAGKPIYNTVEIRSFVDTLQPASLLVSDRYHGCILGLKLGIPTLPCTRGKIEDASKIFSLYKDLGMSEALYTLADPLLSRNKLFELGRDLFVENKVQTLLTSWYEEFDKTSARIFSTLGIKRKVTRRDTKQK
jgi:polysaccharide pyruvyl transferase WcaK-like protein